MKNKQHCLVVKPVVTKLSELKNLIKLCKKNQVYGAVEFHKRFDRQALILKDKYDSGTIGDPLYSWSEYSQKKIVPEKWLLKAHHLLILHGRAVCKSQKPICNKCSIYNFCKY